MWSMHEWIQIWMRSPNPCRGGGFGMCLSVTRMGGALGDWLTFVTVSVKVPVDPTTSALELFLIARSIGAGVLPPVVTVAVDVSFVGFWSPGVLTVAVFTIVRGGLVATATTTVTTLGAPDAMIADVVQVIVPDTAPHAHPVPVAET